MVLCVVVCGVVLVVLVCVQPVSLLTAGRGMHHAHEHTHTHIMVGQRADHPSTACCATAAAT